MNFPAAASSRKGPFRLRPFLGETSGSELVEFAVSAGLLLMVIFAIIDGSRVVYVHHFVAQAAEAGVRYSTIRGNSWLTACASATTPQCIASASNVSTYVMQTATVGVTAANLTVLPTWSGTTPDGDACSDGTTTNAPGCMITVQVKYVFKFTLPFIPHSTVTMSSSASGVIQM